MPLTAVEPLRLYRQIAGQIAALIERGEFAPGSKLPAERELATLLGVSRTSVREAIISLEIAGLVEVRVGTGIFVRDAARHHGGHDGSDTDDAPGPFDLLSARALIEGEIAAVAARHARKADVQSLRDAIARMRHFSASFEERDAADRDFHARIAAMTGNGAFAYVVAGLWDQRRGELWQRIEAHFHTPELRAKTIVDHEAIADAIAARDPDAARAAMRRHLARVAREFQRGVDPGTRVVTARRPRAGAEAARLKSA